MVFRMNGNRTCESEPLSVRCQITKPRLLGAKLCSQQHICMWSRGRLPWLAISLFDCDVFIRTGWEWLVSLAIGAGCIPVSFVTRFITRNVFGVNVPQAGMDNVEMDIGYGAVVTPHSEGKTAVVSDSEAANGGGTSNGVKDNKNTELTALKNAKHP